jgi:hypothetical protein
MTNYGLPNPAHTCTVSGKELRPGDRFIGVLLEQGDKFVRKDYAVDSWQGAPVGAIAHWSGRIPVTGSVKKPTLDDDRLFDCFDQLAEANDAAKRNFRYVTALLLMRRKKLKFEDARKNPQGADVLIVQDTRNGRRYEVIDPKLSEAEAEAVQILN